MKILSTFKFLFLGGIERQYINISIQNKLYLFRFLYFIRWGNDMPNFSRVSDHLKRLEKILYLRNIYDMLGIITYTILSVIIYDLLVTLKIQTAIYSFIFIFSISLIITILLKQYLIKRQKIKFCISFLVENLVAIIILLDGNPLIINDKSSHLNIKQWAEIHEIFNQQTFVKQVKQSVNEVVLEDRFGNSFREN